jgi:outer membrane protein OmpA-like peptidoglycan-associated protein
MSIRMRNFAFLYRIDAFYMTYSSFFIIARTCFLLLSIWLVPCLLSAQNPAATKRRGDEYFRANRYQDAVLQYAQYQLEKPGDLDVLTRLAISYYEVRDIAKAIEYFEFVLSSGARNAKPEAFYYLAKSYHLLEKWPEAIKYYKLYLGVAAGKHPLRSSAVDEIRRCAFAREHKPTELISLVQNLGTDVNSIYDEIAPVPSINRPDRVFFSSSRLESVGGLRRSDGIADEIAGHYTSDIYYADRQQNGTHKLGQLPELINTARHEKLQDFTNGGKVMYFFRGFDLYAGDILIDTAGIKDEHKLEQPLFDSPMAAEKGDQDLFVVNDSLIFFTSRRSGGFGGLDIYYAQKTQGAWETPVNMGSETNSAYDDRSPYLSLDGNTLYFASNRTESLGGLDVFTIQYDPLKRSWLTAINPGAPLNSAADDTGFRVATGGKFAWLASNRQGGTGGFDLYMAYFKKAGADGSKRTVPAFLRANDQTTGVQQTRNFKTLVYTSEQDVLSAQNQEILKEIVTIAKANPQGMIVLTSHTEEAATPALDAFVAAKRAQIISGYLQKLGIPGIRITARSCGSAYPAALNVLGEEQNELSKKYNNRFTVELINLTNRSYIIKSEPLQVPEVMRAEGQAFYQAQNEGISYRVQFLTVNQMFTDDVLGMFPDLSIEHFTLNGKDQYRYCAGLWKEAAPTVLVREDLKAQGFATTRIVPYLYGKEITREEAVVLRVVYPDLNKFLNLK